MKKIKAVCYTNPILGLIAFQSQIPAKEMSDHSGVKHYSCFITISDKEYKKLKGFIERMEKAKKLARKIHRSHQVKFKLVKT